MTAIDAPHPEIADVLDQYATLLDRTGRPEEAMRAEHARANDLK